MNIYSNQGTKVRYTGQHGLDHDRRYANEHLQQGEVYTVDRTVVHSWSTDVYLQEVPGKCFNSVLFEDEKDRQGRHQAEFWEWAEVEYAQTVSAMRQIWHVEMLARNAENN